MKSNEGPLGKNERSRAKREMLEEQTHEEQRRAVGTVFSTFMDGHCLTLGQLLQMINEGRAHEDRFKLDHVRVAVLELASQGSIRTVEIGGEIYYRGPRSKDIRAVPSH